MKKIIINISECTFEKLRFEAMIEKKSVHEILVGRIFEKPFSATVEEAFYKFCENEVKKI